MPKSFTRDSLDVLFKISQGILWQSFYIHYCCHSLLQELENFDIKTIFAIRTSTKGISSIKPEVGILIIYSYSVIDVRTWWFGWVQEIQEAIFKRKHSSSALLLICNKHSWDTIAAKIKSYKRNFVYLGTSDITKISQFSTCKSQIESHGCKEYSQYMFDK